MKYLISFLLSVFLLAGCGMATTEEPVVEAQSRPASGDGEIYKKFLFEKFSEVVETIPTDCESGDDGVPCKDTDATAKEIGKVVEDALASFAVTSLGDPLHQFVDYLCLPEWVDDPIQRYLDDKTIPSASDTNPPDSHTTAGYTYKGTKFGLGTLAGNTSCKITSSATVGLPEGVVCCRGVFEFGENAWATTGTITFGNQAGNLNGGLVVSSDSEGETTATIGLRVSF